MRTVLHLDTERGWRGGERQVWELHAGLLERGRSSWIAARPGEPLALRAKSTLALELSPHSDLALREARTLAAWARARAAAGEAVLMHAHTARTHAVALLALALYRAPARLVVSRRVDFVPNGLFAGVKYGSARVDRYLAVSSAVGDVLARAGVPRERIAVVRDAVDLSRFPRARRAEIRERLARALDLPEDGLWCLTAAAFVAHKGHRYWIEALPHVAHAAPGAHFLFAGEGGLLRACRARARALGVMDRTRFLGFREDVEDLLVASDLLVAPSVMDGLCSVVLEAQAAGLPVLATRAGGIPEVVEDGRTGRLVEPASPPALARAASELLLDPGARRALAEQALVAVQARDRAALVAETLAVYDAVLPEPERPARASSHSLA